MSVIHPTTVYDEFACEPHDFTIFPFPLDDFQKYAIHAICEREHVLITAHTGSGKSVPAEYAIHHYLQNNPDNVVIYTSPIKSLTNQKFHDFQQKFPQYSFGLLTGDIKLNPSAQCILMTTEILRNALMRRETTTQLQNFDHFELDLTRVRCVVFDEIHYINDAERGSVWEESILWLPRSIPMVLLSATLDRAHEFAGWIAEQKQTNVWYLSNEHRVVPLEHYMLVCLPKQAFKEQSTKSLKPLKMGTTHGTARAPKPSSFTRTLSQWMMEHAVPQVKESAIAPFWSEHGKFMLQHAGMLTRIRSHLDKQHVRLHENYVMNQMSTTLKHLDRLPAVVFVFNRRLTEKFASMIRASMFPTETGEYAVKGSSRHEGTDYQITTMSTDVIHEAHRILRKLPNWKEYTELPEFNRMLDLLKKGVCYHHSGVHPVLREMVEMLFQQGYIRLLFSTETLAVGVNMPARSVVMTSVMKWDGRGMRILRSHEYTQMAGRAGRRGMDTKGYVYHLLWKDVPIAQQYECMMSGKPQAIVSKFRLSSLTILRVMSAIALETGQECIHEESIVKHLQGTLVEKEVMRQSDVMKKEWEECREKREKREKEVDEITIPRQILEKYVKTKSTELAMQYDGLVRHARTWVQYQDLCKIEQEKEEQMNRIHTYMRSVVSILVNHLVERQLMQLSCGDPIQVSLTPTGKLMGQLHETPSALALVMEQVEASCREKQTMIELLAGLASGMVRMEGNQIISGNVKHELNEIIFRRIEEEQRQEENWCRRQTEQLDMEEVVECGYAPIPLILRWCIATDEATCRGILQEVNEVMFIGEWVKLLLKIVNIARELATVFEKQGKMGCVVNLTDVPEMVMKSIVTNQSLYL